MEIKLIPFKENSENRLLQPIPAIQSLPDWYKAKSPFIDGGKTTQAFPNNTKNVTVKWCNPFGDAFGAGYFILLENDVQVNQSAEDPVFTWLRGGDDFISTHAKSQIAPALIPQGYSDQPYKFMNSWGIQTPPGYSTLFTHPLNRTELPFLTLSGVVDTDSYTMPVNFPFIIRQDYEGILQAGTPIAQVIPFKRDSWKLVTEKYDPEKIDALNSTFKRKIHRPYKLGYWKRKEYK